MHLLEPAYAVTATITATFMKQHGDFADSSFN